MRKSTRITWAKTAEQHKITAIATEYSNSSHVVTPRSMLGKRLWVMTQEQYDELRDRRKHNGDED